MFLTQTLHRNEQQQRHVVGSIYGNRVRTHGDIVQRVARVAGALRRAGVGSGDRVALLGPNSDRYLEAIAAIAWADAVFVPLNVRWSSQELSYALADAGCVAMFAGSSFADMVPTLVSHCPQLTTVINLDDDGSHGLAYEDLIEDDQPIADACRSDDALAGLFYTGGTTGRSKGVMLSHRNLMTAGIGLTSGDPFYLPRSRVLHAAPLFHIAAVGGWVTQLILGGSAVIIDGFKAEVVLEIVEKHQVQGVSLIPTMVEMLLNHPDFGKWDLSSLTDLSYGGSAMSGAALARVRAAFHGVRLKHGYGLTEASTSSFLSDEDHGKPQAQRSVGRATAHSLLRIEDRDGSEVPPGTVGEICVRGDHVMMGYWNMPEETKHALRGGWMHTGDIGVLNEDGYLSVVDRLKDIIISGGENVYSAEVENAVAEHPAVRECAVIAVPDDKWGERVHAVVVLRPGSSLTQEELKKFCALQIAGYKCPRSMQILDSLPLSPAGKVLKTELRSRYLDTVQV